MKKDDDILKVFYHLIKELKEDVDYIKKSLNEEDFETYEESKPICIPPEVYKEICKILKSKNIGFMGIS